MVLLPLPFKVGIKTIIVAIIVIVSMVTISWMNRQLYSYGSFYGGRWLGNTDHQWIQLTIVQMSITCPVL